MTEAHRYDITKTYPARGPMGQYRLATSTAFRCFRCGSAKTSKLVTTFRDDWGRLLCNGCYGRLLSIHEVKAGGRADDERTDALTALLTNLLSAEEGRRAEERLLLREARAEVLNPKALRLLATAEFVSERLEQATELDWSAAVIGLCKAVEVEVVQRLVEPLAEQTRGLDLAVDCADKDIGRVAKYCAGRAAKPPEIGVVRHFLQTAANSTARREASPLLQALEQLLRRWPNADWLLRADGATAVLGDLTTRFRNPAAHTDELSAEDYSACSKLVMGAQGVLWEVVRATAV